MVRLMNAKGIPLLKARKYAARVVELLKPHCDRIEIAGSIRRGKSEVGDIDIVCIPKKRMDMLGQPDGNCEGFCSEVGKWEVSKGDARFDKHIRRILPGGEGIGLDIFIAVPDTYGWMLAMRTGSIEFNRRIYIQRLKEKGCYSEDGAIYRKFNGCITQKEVNGYMQYFAALEKVELVAIKEEKDLFDLIDFNYVDPKDRE